MTDYRNATSYSKPNLKPSWDVNAHPVLESKTVSGAEKALDIEITLMEVALREVMVHIPTSEMRIEVQPNGANVLVARGTPMYFTKINRFAIPEMTVEAGWLSWPPPQKSKTRRSRRSRG
jgi:hypothetical protein